jgi:hypothetical protein
LEIPFPFRILDTLSEAPSFAGKNERIMEHPGEALQGLKHHITVSYVGIQLTAGCIAWAQRAVPELLQVSLKLRSGW